MGLVPSSQQWRPFTSYDVLVWAMVADREYKGKTCRRVGHLARPNVSTIDVDLLPDILRQVLTTYLKRPCEA
jgi:hypothetical protein